MAGKVFMACALGGGVGALVALQMWQPLWWVGMIVGGLTGYLTYEFNEVCRAVLLAWQKVTGWRPVCESWKTFFRLLPAVAVGPALSISLFIAVITVPFVVLESAEKGEVDLSMYCYSVGFVFVFLSGLIARVDVQVVVDGKKSLQEVLAVYWAGSVFWIALRAVKAVKNGPRLVARTAVVVAKFLWQVFILIHSEMRLLCGLDAAIGAAIGYWLGNALIGALAGGIFGLVNFEVISKRWLKLVPIGTK